MIATEIVSEEKLEYMQNCIFQHIYTSMNVYVCLRELQYPPKK